MDSIRRQARLAGALYALIAVAGPLSLVYLPGKVFSPGAAGSAADHVRASAGLLRLGLGSELLYQTVEVFLILVLYGLFKPVGPKLARSMAVLGLLPIPIVMLNVLSEIAALSLVSGPKFLAGLGGAQADALAALCFFLHGQGLQIAAIFWGLWLVPLGLLIFRCGFIPRILGASVMIAAAGYVLGAAVTLVFPQYARLLAGPAVMLELGEPPIILWLLIFGARGSAPRPTGAVGAAQAG